MENPPKETAKDAFLHLLSAAMIYLTTIGFIVLWYQIINFLVPDKLNPMGVGSWTYESLIWGASVLAVAFPVHVLVSWIIGKDLRLNPQKREAGVRKWLWYITLFVSAVTIVIDLIVLIYNYLRGDLTMQFFLKCIVILVTVAAVFGYYLWDLRKREAASGKPKKVAIIVAVAIVVSIIFGFSLFGSPAHQRDLRFDEQRVGDLQSIQYSVVNYWQQKRQLPAKLDELAALSYGNPKDPDTGTQYEYSVTGDLSFTLCATFKTVLSQEKASGRAGGGAYPTMTGVATVPQNWAHEAARTCYDSTIDPEFFKEPAGSSPEDIKIKNMMLP